MDGTGNSVDICTDGDADPFALPPLPSRRRKGGRPPASRAFRSDFVRIRVLPSEKGRLTGAARKAGYPDLSSWSRGVLLAACDGESPPVVDEAARDEVARLRRDLGSGIGNNLNQALAHANATAKSGAPVDTDELVAAVAAARVALDALRTELRQALRRDGRS